MDFSEKTPFRKDPFFRTRTLHRRGGIIRTLLSCGIAQAALRCPSCIGGWGDRTTSAHARGGVSHPIRFRHPNPHSTGSRAIARNTGPIRASGPVPATSVGISALQKKYLGPSSLQTSSQPLCPSHHVLHRNLLIGAVQGSLRGFCGALRVLPGTHRIRNSSQWCHHACDRKGLLETMWPSRKARH